MAMAVRKIDLDSPVLHSLDSLEVQELERLYRETGTAVLCEDGHAVKLIKEEE